MPQRLPTLNWGATNVSNRCIVREARVIAATRTKLEHFYFLIIISQQSHNSMVAFNSVGNIKCKWFYFKSTNKQKKQLFTLSVTAVSAVDVLLSVFLSHFNPFSEIRRQQHNSCSCFSEPNYLIWHLSRSSRCDIVAFCTQSELLSCSDG